LVVVLAAFLRLLDDFPVNIASNRPRLIDIVRLPGLTVARARRSATFWAIGDPDMSEIASSLAIARP
jgi:hypothetical protein